MRSPSPPSPPVARRAPARGRILVVSPHPDDETLGMGGTLRLHALQGDPVTICFVCSGIQGDPDGYLERSGLEDLRKEEARRACAELGIEDLRFWGYPDNLSEADFGTVFENLPDEPEEQRWALILGFAQKLGRLIDEEGFDILYHPWEGELNGDHWAAGQAVRALREARPDLEARTAFLGYDVWTALPPDTVIDISDVVEDKVRAARAYASQFLYRDYTEAVLGLDAYRSLFLERGATHGEAFTGRYLDEEAPR